MKWSLVVLCSTYMTSIVDPLIWYILLKSIITEVLNLLSTTYVKKVSTEGLRLLTEVGTEWGDSSLLSLLQPLLEPQLKNLNSQYQTGLGLDGINILVFLLWTGLYFFFNTTLRSHSTIYTYMRFYVSKDNKNNNNLS